MLDTMYFTGHTRVYGNGHLIKTSHHEVADTRSIYGLQLESNFKRCRSVSECSDTLILRRLRGKAQFLHNLIEMQYRFDTATLAPAGTRRCFSSDYSKALCVILRWWGASISHSLRDTTRRRRFTGQRVSGWAYREDLPAELAREGNTRINRDFEFSTFRAYDDIMRISLRLCARNLGRRPLAEQRSEGV